MALVTSAASDLNNLKTIQTMQRFTAPWKSRHSRNVIGHRPESLFGGKMKGLKGTKIFKTRGFWIISPSFDSI